MANSPITRWLRSRKDFRRAPRSLGTLDPLRTPCRNPPSPVKPEESVPGRPTGMSGMPGTIVPSWPSFGFTPVPGTAVPHVYGRWALPWSRSSEFSPWLTRVFPVLSLTVIRTTRTLNHSPHDVVWKYGATPEGRLHRVRASSARWPCRSRTSHWSSPSDESMFPRFSLRNRSSSCWTSAKFTISELRLSVIPPRLPPSELRSSRIPLDGLVLPRVGRQHGVGRRDEALDLVVHAGEALGQPAALREQLADRSLVVRPGPRSSRRGTRSPCWGRWP